MHRGQFDLVSEPKPLQENSGGESQNRMGEGSEEAQLKPLLDTVLRNAPAEIRKEAAR